ncbi:MAG: L-threonylcarbamoyladenylate synthase [Alphaproteobacteria bacterium]|nr:L-threonylcarbamoyladenylate synthase [Alphaproteobacteria bacterium]
MIFPIHTTAEAAAWIAGGQLLAFETETVWGLGADCTNDRAVASVYRTKGRPSHNPLIVHVATYEQAHALAQLTPEAVLLARAFWPGALTMVLRQITPDSTDRVDSAGSHRIAPSQLLIARDREGSATVALRIPDHPSALALIKACGPLAAPSANASGRVTATSAAHVCRYFAGVGQVVGLYTASGAQTSATEATATNTETTDSQQKERQKESRDHGSPPAPRRRHNMESTIVDVSQPGRVCILRHGAITAESIDAVLRTSLGRLLDDAPTPPTATSPESPPPLAPGMLTQHYAPQCRIRLDALAPEQGEVYVDFGTQPAPRQPSEQFPTHTHTHTSHPSHDTLSPTGSLEEAASALYALLHRYDDPQYRLAFAPIPRKGLGIAINDRLQRAAAR